MVPLYMEEAVQQRVWWTRVGLTLQQMLTSGNLREGRASCRMLKFAVEFGISASFEPFALGERRVGEVGKSELAGEIERIRPLVAARTPPPLQRRHLPGSRL